MKRDYTSPILQEFSKIAILIPNKICIEDDQKSLTYDQLMERIDSMADILKSKGVFPGERIVIPIENGVDSIIALLSIIETGATAVLIDPRLPSSDLHRLINNSDPVAVLSLKTTMERLVPQSIPGLPVWDIQDNLSPNPKFPEKAAPKEYPDLDPDVAVILYTSGTSGDYKGVMLTHQNLLIALLFNNSGFVGSSNFYCVLPLYHIFSLVSVCLYPLLNGGFIKFYTLETIFKTFQRGQPFIFAVVPRILEYLLAKVQADPGVRGLFQKLNKDFVQLVCGGAPLSLRVEQAYSEMGHPIYCGYGLTETSGGCTVMSKNKKIVMGSVGFPFPGTELRINQPNETGVGEICIRSATVMKGYFRNPKATAEAIRDGWFYTGDLGYINPEGYLFITGRVKEIIVLPTGEKAMPDNIESHYLGIRGVKELAVVGIQAKGQVWDEIHAAVIPENKEGNFREIEERIQERSNQLPFHLQIQKVHRVSEIPRTSLQKVRRGILKETLKSDTGVQAAPTPITEDPIYLWLRLWLAKSAGINPAEVDENRYFIAYGVDSLSIWQLCEKLNEEYHMNVTPVTIMENPSIAKLAEYIKANQNKGKISKIPPLSLADRTQDLPASFAEETHWERAGYPWQNYLYCDDVVGPLDFPLFEKSILTLFTRHEMLRTTYHKKENLLVRMIHPEPKEAFRFFDFSSYTEEKQKKELEQLVESYGNRNLDLGTLPLVHFALIKFSPNRHVLVALFARLVVDGASLALLVEDLAIVYKDLIEKKTTSSLPPQKFQYADFAFWQRSLYDQGVFKEEEEYWKQQFKKMELVPIPGRKVQLTKEQQLLKENLTSKTLPIMIPQAFCKELATIALQRNAFFQTLLATAFQIALYHATKNPNITIRELNIDRKKSDLQRMIGYLNTAFGIIGDFSKDRTFEDHLADHQKQLYLATMNGNIFFEALVGKWGSLIKGAPPFSLNVSFNFLAFQIPTKLGNLDISIRDLYLQEFLYPPGLELDFVLMVAPDGSVKGGLSYKKAIVDEASIGSIPKDFLTVLFKIAQNPAILISEIFK